MAAIFLHSTFSPFVLEGFRMPLLPIKGVTATRVAHPKRPQAVELTIAPGQGVTVTSVLRWPGADFLERRAGSVLNVKEEHSDQTLKFCVPKAAELVDGRKNGDGSTYRHRTQPPATGRGLRPRGTCRMDCPEPAGG